MLRFQKYLLPTQHNVPASSHYVTAYLQLNINSELNQKLNEIVSITNLNLHKNLNLLKNGKFDHISTNYTVKPCDPLKLNLPYEYLNNVELSNIDNIDNNNNDISCEIYNKFIKNQLINTNDLEIDNWFPQDFKYIGMKVRTLQFHISLLPLIRFDNEFESLSFYNKFRNLSIEKIRIPVKLSGKLKIFAKYDYTKFFLGLCVDGDSNQNSSLYQLLTSISQLRYLPINPTFPSKGYVIGEIKNHIVKWEESSLHMSIAVCNSESSTEPPLFGSIELSYLNNILLKQLDYEPITLEGRLVFVIDQQHLVY
jgi:hypothetical protein